MGRQIFDRNGAAILTAVCPAYDAVRPDTNCLLLLADCDCLLPDGRGVVWCGVGLVIPLQGAVLRTNMRIDI